MKKLAKKSQRRKEVQHKIFEMVIRKLPKELGEEAGVSDVCLYNWRSGAVANHRFNGVIRVAEALGLEIKAIDPAMMRVKPASLRRVS
jgi:hypothetical protein